MCIRDRGNLHYDGYEKAQLPVTMDISYKLDGKKISAEKLADVYKRQVFLKGCPLNCRWCHNPELIDFRQQLIQSPNNCIGCGHCIKICPEGALSVHPEKGISVDRRRCSVCLKCADECYARALRPVAEYMSVEEILDICQQDKDFYEHTGGGITAVSYTHLDVYKRQT